jgi:hypothetical protein
MEHTQCSFGSESIELMGRVCNEAWREVQTITFYPSPKDSDEMLRLMVMRVMAAVAAGEHDPARLKVVALDGVEA